ncbi:hypothetical protein [Nocardia alni]|uniref:hypothetical protein n=1 Tax=Nocardia alni TaxID=2815723 RepID=UPI001C24EFBA|nr:hypothetical protein [Nocardia alni]
MPRTETKRRTKVAVLVTMSIAIITLTLDLLTAMDAGPAPEPLTHSGVLQLIPNPVACLLETGFALGCLR